MDEQNKVKGPASYFPAIEQKYGQPIAHWLALLAGREERKHMASTAWATAMPMPWWPTIWLRGKSSPSAALRHGRWPRRVGVL